MLGPDHCLEPSWLGPLDSVQLDLPPAHVLDRPGPIAAAAGTDHQAAAGSCIDARIKVYIDFAMCL